MPLHCSGLVEVTQPVVSLVGVGVFLNISESALGYSCWPNVPLCSYSLSLGRAYHDMQGMTLICMGFLGRLRSLCSKLQQVPATPIISARR